MSEALTNAYIKPIIQTWLQSFNCTKDSSDPNRMFLEKTDLGQRDENGCCKSRFGIIQFYDRSSKKKYQGGFYGDIMELSIYEVVDNPDKKGTSLSEFLYKTAAQPIYYLHFAMHDFEFVLSQISSFFHFFYQMEEEAVKQELPDKMEKILICCTCGLTSGYYGALLKKKLDKDLEGNTIQVQGANVKFLPSMIDDFDVVLLTPQIYFMEKELKEKYGKKIQLINRVEFATFKFNSILDKIYSVLKKKPLFKKKYSFHPLANRSTK